MWIRIALPSCTPPCPEKWTINPSRNCAITVCNCSGVAGSIFNRSKPALLAMMCLLIAFHSDSSSNARNGSPLKSTSGLAGINNNGTRS